ncbi:MAG: TonB-dependent receptor [Deltaproteobacteria bacterium]|nr:MAG: TonB-dependent receptor [Deltaproteobacteria bacterium]
MIGLLLALAWAEEPEDEAVEEVVVEGTSTWRETPRGSRQPSDSPATEYSLTRRDLESTPGSMEDVARAVHALPGVVSDGDVAAGFHVRGGDQAEVVYLLDRVPLENPFHLAGYNSLFNPDMLREVRFVPSAAGAEHPAATSAVLDVHTWAGCPDDGCEGVDGAVDLSASSARVMVSAPLDRHERLSVALAARRTWLEAYFAVLKGTNLIDRAFVAPEFSELSARVAWRPTDDQRVLLSLVRAGDHLALIDSEDPSTVQFDGAFELASSLSLASLDHRLRTRQLEWQTTAAITLDDTFSQRELERDTLGRDTRLGRLFARSDATWRISPNTRVRAGIDTSRFRVDSDGMLQDQRSFPTWVQPGIGAYGFQVVEVASTRTWSEASSYAQLETGVALGEPVGPLTPGIKGRAGVRIHGSSLTGQLLASPRFGLSAPLPTGTVLRAALGWYQRPPRDPFQLAPGFGNPRLGAERARHLVIGVDQGFPLPGLQRVGLARVEVYDLALTELVVGPDTEEALREAPSLTNAGYGHSRGVDVMVAARGGWLNAELAWGLLFAERTNPRNAQFARTVAPAQDQRHTWSLSADFPVGERWRFTGRYAGHTGRPTSTVQVRSVEWSDIALTCLNCERLGPTHQVDVRAEWRKAITRGLGGAPYRLTAYLELLNVGNVRSEWLDVHEVVGTEVETSALYHLPMRPFFGLRAEF